MNARTRLPRAYFADAPTLSPAGHPTVASHSSPHGTTGASPALETAPADDTANGRQGDHFARHAAGVGHRAYSVAAARIARAQQLRAARIMFGKQH